MLKVFNAVPIRAIHFLRVAGLLVTALKGSELSRPGSPRSILRSSSTSTGARSSAGGLQCSLSL